MSKNKLYGWVPDVPDHRDYCFAPTVKVKNLPKRSDLRPWCPPIYDQKSLGSCHDSDTEVLTSGGWRLFSELDGSEMLATVDPDSRKLLFEKPIRLIKLPYKGDLFCVKNQSLNFRVTPDHKMLVRKWDQSKRTLDSEYKQIAAKDLGWYCGLMNKIVWNGHNPSNNYILSGIHDHKHKPQRIDRSISMKTWMRFLGIYLAEGTLLKKDQGIRKDNGCKRICYDIQIAASKEREKSFIREILTDLKVGFMELPDRFRFSNRQIYEEMEYLGLSGIKAGKKFVPSFVFRQNSEMIKEFLLGHFSGDGSEQRGLKSHYTSSSQLAKDLQLLVFMSGNESRVSVRAARSSVMSDGRVVNGKLPEHRVSVCELKNLSINRKEDIFLEPYEGYVYCAEVPTYHTLVTRREGKILISGNCTGNAIAAAHQFDQMHQKLDAYTPSRLFIYYNERSLEGTINSDSGAAIRDGIKTLSQFGVCPESEWPYDINQFATKPPKKCFDDASQHKNVLYERVNRTLNDMKSCLASGLPFVFGFSVYDTFESDKVAKTGVVPMPSKTENCLGGHAVMAVGYIDDTKRFIVRNSWGSDWGLKGYFTMPYDYLLDSNLSDDFWVIRKVN